MPQFKSFEELECWKAGTIVRRFIKELIINFPVLEKFGLTDNMRRASRSVTQNIAEGFGRFHYQENIQFCRISRGSLFELIDQLITSLDENYISKEEYDEGRQKIENALRLLNGYINYLEKQKKTKKN
jgi:four helix bundle protein